MEDAQVLERLYAVVKQSSREDYESIIEQEACYPFLYHLSRMRENLIDWLSITEEMCVLERNAECGALTGKLLERAGEVVSITQSDICTKIIQERYKEAAGKLLVCQGDVPMQMRFDRILIIGNTYQYRQELEWLKHLLKKDGRLILADANRLGLKYIAGCQEEYQGGYFTGVEGYVRQKQTAKEEDTAEGRCYTRNEYIRILRDAGFKRIEFYYPYPDYKFPSSIYSDQYLPKKGELFDNRRNFDRDRYQLFDESLVYDTLLSEGLFGAFSNSFLIEAGAQEE